MHKVIGKPGQRTSFTAIEVKEGDRVGRELTYTLKNTTAPTAIRGALLGGWHAVPFAKAQYVLIDRLDVKTDECEIDYDYYGTIVSVVLLPGTDATYVYYKVDQDLQPVSINILAALSRHFLQDFGGYYNDWCSLDSVFEALPSPKKRRTRIPLYQLPFLDKPKISGTHHIHFTAEEVFDALDDDGKSRAVHALRLPLDSTTSFIAGVMLWLASLTDEMYTAIRDSGLLESDSATEFAKHAKKLSIRAKSLQNLVPSDLRMIFEADVLVNRNVGEVDWEGEKHNRTKPNLVKLKAGTVYQKALTLFTKPDDDRERARGMKWQTFWDARWQWSASGSIHSQYLEDVKDVPKARELKNKFIALILAEDTTIDKYLDRAPQLQAWSSVKYEWGKMRAIYGTDLTSYVLAHYAFYNCEDTLTGDFPVGKKARPSYVSAKVAATLENSIQLCIDFEDFNSQHSNQSMIEVIDAYIDANRHDLDKDQIRAAQWTKESILNTQIHDNMGTKTTYDSKGTLMSGWRLTTYMNSVLNYIYTKMLTDGHHVRAKSIHNGDDVLLGVRNFEAVRNIVRRAEIYNIRLQRTKCAFGGIAEFLRVDHMRGDYGQYLTRNIATVMHSRIESKIAINAVDVVQSMESRLTEYLQRGGVYRYAADLRLTYYRRMAPIYNLTVEDFYDIRESHRVVGGIQEAENAQVKKTITIDREPMSTELPEHLPGVIAYAKSLKETLSLDVHVSEVIKRIKRATLNAVQMTRNNIKVVETEDVQRYMALRSLYKSYADVTDSPLFGKAMLTGFVFDVLTTSQQLEAVARIISTAKDKMEFLRIIS
uniref:RNA-directed RNA polymerase n=1 Tax=Conidiobolus adiaeretus totivirus 2 TaxID=2980974 RepID=A0A977R5H0_9VIRU|nr:RNA-dependent RNA polymerase [Conidiobolus adiaeretus totivirus 2]